MTTRIQKNITDFKYFYPTFLTFHGIFGNNVYCYLLWYIFPKQKQKCYKDIPINVLNSKKFIRFALYIIS